MKSSMNAGLQIAFSRNDPKISPKTRKPCICKGMFSKFLMCDLTENFSA